MVSKNQLYCVTSSRKKHWKPFWGVWTQNLQHKYELPLLDIFNSVFLSHIRSKFSPEVKKKYCMQSNAYKAVLLLALVTTTLIVFIKWGIRFLGECAPSSRKPAAVGPRLKKPLNLDELHTKGCAWVNLHSTTTEIGKQNCLHPRALIPSE